MVRTSENPPIFYEATVIDLTTHGIRLSSPVEFIDGTATDIVSASVCYEFDQELMDHCNKIVGYAMDMLTIVNEMIATRARSAFMDFFVWDNGTNGQGH